MFPVKIWEVMQGSMLKMNISRCWWVARMRSWRM